MIKLLKDCPSSAFGVLFSHPEFHSTCPITMTKLLEDCPSSVLSVLVITLAPLSLHFHKEILFPLLREYYLFLQMTLQILLILSNTNCGNSAATLGIGRQHWELGGRTGNREATLGIGRSDWESGVFLPILTFRDGW